MVTMNISLTDDQVKQVDLLQKKHGFANRSELFRAILRFVTSDVGILSEVASYPFLAPPTRNKNEILSAFKTKGGYSKRFVSDLKRGLDRSSYFND